MTCPDIGWKTSSDRSDTKSWIPGPVAKESTRSAPVLLLEVKGNAAFPISVGLLTGAFWSR